MGEGQAGKEGKEDRDGSVFQMHGWIIRMIAPGSMPALIRNFLS
jgi:hypothetical protein